jgi:3-hydroxyacyl-[acyl-carrier-protein] dehydratase
VILSDSFHSVSELNKGEQQAAAVINFNAAHPIFGGHFPEVPVVPGVCMMQIVKEFVEHVTGLNTDLKQVSQMKFLTLITPREVPAVKIEINYSAAENGALMVNASLFNEGVVYFKFKGTLVIAGEKPE